MYVLRIVHIPINNTCLIMPDGKVYSKTHLSSVGGAASVRLRSNGSAEIQVSFSFISDR